MRYIRDTDPFHRPLTIHPGDALVPCPGRAEGSGGIQGERVASHALSQSNAAVRRSRIDVHHGQAPSLEGSEAALQTLALISSDHDDAHRFHGSRSERALIPEVGSCSDFPSGGLAAGIDFTAARSDAKNLSGALARYAFKSNARRR